MPNYQDECLCGSTDFNTVKIMTGGPQNYQTFRMCKVCGTLKMYSSYFNEETKQYQDAWIKKNKEEK